MPRLTIVLVALVALLAGGLGVSLVDRPQPSVDTAAIRAVVDAALAERTPDAPAPQAVAAIDPTSLNPLIEQYLLSDPSILQRMNSALETQVRTTERTAARATIASLQDVIFNDPDSIVLGNPDGDVTLVEMFDYNCGYCRNALPDLATLLAEDKNLKVILKEFPILSEQSVDAARVAVLVAQSDVDYWTFHENLFTNRGQVTKETALKAAQDLGLNRVNLELEMGTPTVTSALQKSYRIAQALSITGTPTYIIGDEVIPGAIGIDGLRQRVKNMRDCGAPQCAS